MLPFPVYETAWLSSVVIVGTAFWLTWGLIRFVPPEWRGLVAIPAILLWVLASWYFYRIVISSWVCNTFKR